MATGQSNDTTIVAKPTGSPTIVAKPTGSPTIVAKPTGSPTIVAKPHTILLLAEDLTELVAEDGLNLQMEAYGF